MEWNYPYVKRPLKDKERDALIYFVCAVLNFGIAIGVFFKRNMIPPDILVALVIIFAAGMGILCISRGFEQLKKEGL